MHYFPGLSEETILWQVSYQNLSMYLATIPSYDTDEEPTEEEKPKAKEKREMAELKNFFKTT